jgi:hypothetical protein
MQTRGCIPSTGPASLQEGDQAEPVPQVDVLAYSLASFSTISTYQLAWL